MKNSSFEGLCNQIARCVAYSRIENDNITEIMARVYILVSDSGPFFAADVARDVQSVPIAGLNFGTGHVYDLNEFLHSCKARFEWIERAAINDLEKAVSIERFADVKDREAAREVAALRMRANQRLQDMDIPLVDRKVMVKSDPDTIEALLFKFEDSKDADKLWISTEFRVNPTGEVAIIFFPSGIQSTVISAIAGITQSSFESLEKSVHYCELSLPGYIDGKNYQCVSDENRIRNSVKAANRSFSAA